MTIPCLCSRRVNRIVVYLMVPNSENVTIVMFLEFEDIKTLSIVSIGIEVRCKYLHFQMSLLIVWFNWNTGR